jgi:hypothetical protein
MKDDETGIPIAIYANNVQIYSNLYDIEILFRRAFNKRLDDGSDSVTEDLVSVAMSPQHAKSLYVLLKNIMDAYEEQFGKLPDPKKMRPDGFETMQ